MTGHERQPHGGAEGRAGRLRRQPAGWRKPNRAAVPRTRFPGSRGRERSESQFGASHHDCPAPRRGVAPSDERGVSAHPPSRNPPVQPTHVPLLFLDATRRTEAHLSNGTAKRALIGA